MAEAPEVKDLPEVRRVALDSLQESKTNPRQINDRAVEVLARAIERFGWKQPLVADGDGVLIVGHTRWRAAKRLGLSHVPVIYAEDLTPEEVDAYRIADNRTHDFTSWDFPELVNQLDALADEFADVLALEDWEAVAQQLHGAAASASPGELDLPDEIADSLDGGFQLNVVFRSKDEALQAQETIADLPGVFDVRHALG